MQSLRRDFLSAWGSGNDVTFGLRTDAREKSKLTVPKGYLFLALVSFGPAEKGSPECFNKAVRPERNAGKLPAWAQCRLKGSIPRNGGEQNKRGR